MIQQRYTVQTMTQTNEGGDPVGSLALAPIMEPVAGAEGTATTSRALAPSPVRASRMSIIPITGIPLDEMTKENLKVGDVVTVTVAKEQV